MDKNPYTQRKLTPNELRQASNDDEQATVYDGSSWHAGYSRGMKDAKLVAIAAGALIGSITFVGWSLIWKGIAWLFT